MLAPPRTGTFASVEGLTLETNGSRLTARLDRPDGNLLSLAMCDALVDILTHPPEGAHVLVIEGAGDTFCMGRERSVGTADSLGDEVRRLIAVHEALLHTRLVTVAQVHGDAAGFGVGLAALCDVGIGVRSLTFSFPEVRIDLAPSLVLAWLPRIVGRRQAFWMTATGEPVTGEQAVPMGLLNRVVEDSLELEAEVKACVETLQGHSPRVHAQIKAMLRSSASLSEEQAYELSADQLVVGSLLRRID